MASGGHCLRGTDSGAIPPPATIDAPSVSLGMSLVATNSQTGAALTDGAVEVDCAVSEHETHGVSYSPRVSAGPPDRHLDDPHPADRKGDRPSG